MSELGAHTIIRTYSILARNSSRHPRFHNRMHGSQVHDALKSGCTITQLMLYDSL